MRYPTMQVVMAQLLHWDEPLVPMLNTIRRCMDCCWSILGQGCTVSPYGTVTRTCLRNRALVDRERF